MTMERPDPERLLREIEGEAPATRLSGKLKIFFGYAAGVGKTYAMLKAAQETRAAGTDVVVGYVEPHTRPETLALLEGLESLPSLCASHRNLTLNEFDLDAALRRRPGLILVDELAHTNADGCRHRKRYQDIQELLKSGIDVYTTVNVQHIESLNDIVASITGVIVRERVPDSVFDSAEQVELVDIEPDDLIARLNGGKIYRADQARQAVEHFFTRENLAALREIALRRTADRLNRVKEKTALGGAVGAKFADEHILICLSGSPSNAKVIRTAARMADAFHGTFTALFVETPGFASLSPESQKRLRENLRLAEQLGARIATMYGEDVPAQIAEYAQVSGITKIVIGRSNSKRGLLHRKNLVEQLTALAPRLDIYIIPDMLPPYRVRHALPGLADQFSLPDALKTAGILGLCTAVGYLFRYLDFRDTNIILIFLLGVLFTSVLTQGYLFSALSSLLSVVVFNLCFTYPYFTLAFVDKSYWITIPVMFIVAVLVSTLTMRVKRQAKLEAMKSHRTEILLETSQVLQRAESRGEIFTQGARQLVKLLDRPIVIYPAGAGGLQAPVCHAPDGEAPSPAYTRPDERAVAEWVRRNNKRAGATTSTLPGACCLYMAVRNATEVFAVAGIAMDHYPEIEAFEKNLLVSLLSEFALALEKDQINTSKKQIEVKAQQEQLRANLLRAISHDLRTPLTSISGSASILMSSDQMLTEDKRRQLYIDIYDDSMWLISLVENLLSVTRIENGTMSIHREPELIGEIIDEALSHINRRSCEHSLTVRLSDDMLMASLDSRLIVQVIINIVDNAIKYTPAGSEISLSAFRTGGRVCLEIADDGPGISDEAKRHIFDMFYTANTRRSDSRRGLGLGLSLCKSIITAHGGTICVRDNLPHGTVFSFTLKAEEVKFYE